MATQAGTGRRLRGGKRGVQPSVEPTSNSAAVDDDSSELSDVSATPSPLQRNIPLPSLTTAAALPSPSLPVALASASTVLLETATAGPPVKLEIKGRAESSFPAREVPGQARSLRNTRARKERSESLPRELAPSPPVRVRSVTSTSTAMKSTKNTRSTLAQEGTATIQKYLRTGTNGTRDEQERNAVASSSKLPLMTGLVEDEAAREGRLVSSSIVNSPAGSTPLLPSPAFLPLRPSSQGSLRSLDAISVSLSKSLSQDPRLRNDMPTAAALPVLPDTAITIAPPPYQLEGMMTAREKEIGMARPEIIPSIPLPTAPLPSPVFTIRGISQSSIPSAVDLAPVSPAPPVTSLSMHSDSPQSLHSATYLVAPQPQPDRLPVLSPLLPRPSLSVTVTSPTPDDHPPLDASRRLQSTRAEPNIIYDPPLPNRRAPSPRSQLLPRLPLPSQQMAASAHLSPGRLPPYASLNSMDQIVAGQAIIRRESEAKYPYREVRSYEEGEISESPTSPSLLRRLSPNPLASASAVSSSSALRNGYQREETMKKVAVIERSAVSKGKSIALVPEHVAPSVEPSVEPSVVMEPERVDIVMEPQKQDIVMEPQKQESAPPIVEHRVVEEEMSIDEVVDSTAPEAVIAVDRAEHKMEVEVTRSNEEMETVVVPVVEAEEMNIDPIRVEREVQTEPVIVVGPTIAQSVPATLSPPLPLPVSVSVPVPAPLPPLPISVTAVDTNIATESAPALAPPLESVPIPTGPKNTRTQRQKIVLTTVSPSKSVKKPLEVAKPTTSAAPASAATLPQHPSHASSIDRRDTQVSVAQPIASSAPLDNVIVRPASTPTVSIQVSHPQSDLTKPELEEYVPLKRPREREASGASGAEVERERGNRSPGRKKKRRDDDRDRDGRKRSDSMLEVDDTRRRSRGQSPGADTSSRSIKTQELKEAANEKRNVSRTPRSESPESSDSKARRKEERSTRREEEKSNRRDEEKSNRREERSSRRQSESSSKSSRSREFHRNGDQRTEREKEEWDREHEEDSSRSKRHRSSRDDARRDRGRESRSSRDDLDRDDHESRIRNDRDGRDEYRRRDDRGSREESTWNDTRRSRSPARRSDPALVSHPSHTPSLIRFDASTVDGWGDRRGDGRNFHTDQYYPSPPIPPHNAVDNRPPSQRYAPNQSNYSMPLNYGAPSTSSIEPTYYSQPRPVYPSQQRFDQYQPHHESYPLPRLPGQFRNQEQHPAPASMSAPNRFDQGMPFNQPNRPLLSIALPPRPIMKEPLPMPVVSALLPTASTAPIKRTDKLPDNARVAGGWISNNPQPSAATLVPTPSSPTSAATESTLPSYVPNLPMPSRSDTPSPPPVSEPMVMSMTDTPPRPKLDAPLHGPLQQSSLTAASSMTTTPVTASHPSSTAMIISTTPVAPRPPLAVQPARLISTRNLVNFDPARPFTAPAPGNYSMAPVGIFDRPYVDVPNERSIPPLSFPMVEIIGATNISEYQIMEVLGEGTFGRVVRATKRAPYSMGKGKGVVETSTNGNMGGGKRLKRVDTGTIVALKQTIKHDQDRESGIPITLLREIKLLKALDHPNIVPCLDIAYETATGSEETGTISMVFPCLEHDLAGLLGNKSVNLTEGEIKQYATQLLLGTAYLHKRNIIHRDIKAANLLISNSGVLMIADFGLARYLEPASSARQYTEMVVTRWYRPPELLLHNRRYHCPVDMWGVGCVIAEMYTRTPIFPGDSDLNQAFLIFELCGSPTEETMPDCSKEDEGRDANGNRRFEGRRFVGPTDVFQWQPTNRHVLAHFAHRGKEFADLMDKLLVLDPKRRLTAVESLDHDWFWTLPLPTDPKLMKTYAPSKEKDRNHHAIVARQPSHLMPQAQPYPRQSYPQPPNRGQMYLSNSNQPQQHYSNPSNRRPPFPPSANRYGGAPGQQQQMPPPDQASTWVNRYGQQPVASGSGAVGGGGAGGGRVGGGLNMNAMIQRASGAAPTTSQSSLPPTRHRTDLRR